MNRHASPLHNSGHRAEPLEGEAPQVLEGLAPSAGQSSALEARRLHRRAGLLAAGMLLFGFLGGYGVGFGVRNRETKQVEAKAPRPTALAPIVKGMKLSPDGKLLAFTAVHDGSRRSSRLVLDVQSARFSGAESPGGWQDFVLGWDRSSRSLLLRRERIPRPVAEAKTGFYRQKMLAGDWPRFDTSLAEEKPDLPRGEKSTFGFWDESGRLVVKTRREPKSFYANGKRLDSSPDLYLHQRLVRENGRDALYVVRNSTSAIDSLPALFRVQDGKARRLSEDLEDLEWVHVAEDGRAMIAARLASPEAEDSDWKWTLYQVTPSRARRVREGVIDRDVIGTYWSPDSKSVLGALGESLWIIDVATLKCRKIGDARSANADDAAWSSDSREVFVAVDGKILRVNLKSNQTREIWRFPDQYWN